MGRLLSSRASIHPTWIYLAVDTDEILGFLCPWEASSEIHWFSVPSYPSRENLPQKPVYPCIISPISVPLRLLVASTRGVTVSNTERPCPNLSTWPCHPWTNIQLRDLQYLLSVLIINFQPHPVTPTPSAACWMLNSTSHLHLSPTAAPHFECLKNCWRRWSDRIIYLTVL